MKKTNMRLFSFLLVAVLTFMFGAVGTIAQHDAIITLTPDVANCGQLGNTFNVNVANDVSSTDSIFEVRIYSGTTGITNFACGDAPNGWTLSDYAGGSTLPNYGYCEYKTEYNNDNTIIHLGENLNFTFDATMNSEGCDSEFLISTLDNNRPIGEQKYYWPVVFIDCSAPDVFKTVGNPQSPLAGYGLGDLWIRQSTSLTAYGSDNQSNCDLGLDYCEITYTVDGGKLNTEVNKSFDIGVFNWNYPWTFGEDSEHFITITCYDVAGNSKTITETDKVDDTPPITTKLISEPKKVVSTEIGDIEWVDTVTNITLSAEDPEADTTPEGYDCSIGVDKTYYRITQVDDAYCWREQACTPLDSDASFSEYTGPISDIPESCHLMEYYSIDAIGNKEDIQTNCFFVDKTPPKAEKWIGEPAIIEISAATDDEVMYLVKVTNPTGADISANIVFEGLISAWAGVDNADVSFAFSDDIGYYFDPYHGSCSGLNGNGCGPDFVGQTWEQWLAAHPDWMDWVSTESGTAYPGGDETVGLLWDSKGQIIAPQTIPANSVAWAIVKLDFKVDDVFRFTLKADDSNLEIYHAGMPEKYTIWVNHTTPVELTCADQEPHPSGDAEVCYKVGLDGTDVSDNYCGDGSLETIEDSGYKGDWCCMPDSTKITFGEDSNHYLQYFCRDAVNKKSAIDLEHFKVDGTSPILVKKSIEGPAYAVKGECPPRPGTDDICNLDGVTNINIDVEDTPGICMVDDVWCQWSYVLDGGNTYGPFKDFPIHFPNETQHDLTIECFDALGNKMTDEETFYVDKTPPMTSIDYVGPQYPDPINLDSFPHWVDTATKVTLTATDNFTGKHDSGIKETLYRVTTVDNKYCKTPDSGCSTAQGDGTFVTYTEPFGLPESCQLIEFYSIDNVDKVEDTKRDCVFSDHTAPIASLVSVGQPNILSTDVNDTTSDYWVTQQTEVTLACNNQVDEPHPSPLNKIYWQVKVDDGDFGNVNEADATGGVTLSFTEDSYHTLKFWCDDKVEKTSDPVEKVFRVDTTAPNITLTLKEPFSGNCIEVETFGPKDNNVDFTTGDFGGSECFVDTATRISLDVIDGGNICAIGDYEDVVCEWMYSVSNGDYSNESDWMPYNASAMINFPEESYHTLKVRCTDALGNVMNGNQYYSVDKTPPAIHKEYVGPYFENNSGVEWITSNTEIHISMEDVGPHLSGLKSLDYRVTLLDGNDACNSNDLCQQAEGNGNWISADGYTAVTRIGEESCHLIEITAVDNVGKTNHHKQCVFVDNTPPTPVKTVGTPKSVINHTASFDDYYFQYYPEINGQCWNGSNAIDCWKVTLLTPVNLECEDKGPHPVDHNRVCIKYDLDGADVTLDKCRGAQGSYNESGDGFCCVNSEWPEFHFGEVSEHNLAYYCVDALGNKGEVDDEKFKVEETSFNITLNKKWNLISVPVKLLDDSMDVVFAPIADKVISVWAFNGSDWFVYTPDGNSGNDDITTMKPGWGYWVLMKDDAMLKIGGSLFSPAQTPPEIQVVHGWNLIGYYGAEGQDGYYGPVGAGKPAQCILYSIGSSVWDKGFASLWTYWEIDNPDLWKNLNKYDNMDPGAGYWVFATEAGLYVPTTTCDGLFFGPY